MKAILALPGTALVYVPLLILWVSGHWPFGPLTSSGYHWAIAAVLAIPAFALAAKTMSQFAHEGQGTLAPWDPPRKFVVSGPYRYVRNPMILAVIVLVLAEAIALNSLPIFYWAVFMFVLNTVYFKYSEEPGLERRFGEDYLHYKSAVPRWVPRLRPYPE